MAFSLKTFVLALVVGICLTYAALLCAVLTVQITAVDSLAGHLSASLHAQTITLVESQLRFPKYVAKMLADDFVSLGYHAMDPPPYTDMVLPMVSYAKAFPNISTMVFFGASGYLSELRKETADGPTDLIEVTRPPLYRREHHRLVLNAHNKSAPRVASEYLLTQNTTTYGPNQTYWKGADMPDEGVWMLFTHLNSSVRLSFGTKIMYDGAFQGVVYADYLLATLVSLLRSIAVSEGVTVALIDEQDRLVGSSACSSESVAATGDLLPQATKSSNAVLRDAARFLFSRRDSGRPLVPGKQESIAADGTSYIISTSRMVLDAADGKVWNIVLLFPRATFFAASDNGLIFSIAAVSCICVLSFFFSLCLISSVSKRIRRIVSQVDRVVTYKENAFSTTSVRGDSSRLFRVSEVRALEDSVTRMKTILQSFEKYIPVQLLRYLVSQNQPAELGLERASASVMFLDVAGFTSIMERVPLTDLIEQFTEYCDEAISIIVQSHGTLDKMMGDGMMAFFGCPPTTLRDHQYWAALCALRLQRMMVRLRAKWAREGRVPLFIRVGVASGPVSVGNVGSTQRFQYTVLGDVVNLAARMESLNKRFGTATLVTGHVFEALLSGFVCRRLGTVRVKGRASRTRVYELLTAAELFDTAPPESRPLTAGQQVPLTVRSDVLDEAPSAIASPLSSALVSPTSSLATVLIPADLDLHFGAPQGELFEVGVPGNIAALPPAVVQLHRLCALFSRAVSRYEARHFEDALRLLQFYHEADIAGLRTRVHDLEQQCSEAGEAPFRAEPEGYVSHSLCEPTAEQRYTEELLERCTAYVLDPPPRNWDSVLTMTEK